MTRRDFLGQVALAAAAIVATGCGAGSDMTGIGSGPLPGGSLTIKLADYAGLANRALAPRAVVYDVANQTLTIS